MCLTNYLLTYHTALPKCSCSIAFYYCNQATRLSLGIGFIAAYSPNTSSNVWVQPFDCQPNLFGELGLWHRLQLPSKGAPIREVTCGRSHVVALTTKGEGMFSCLYTSHVNYLVYLNYVCFSVRSWVEYLWAVWRCYFMLWRAFTHSRARFHRQNSSCTISAA